MRIEVVHGRMLLCGYIFCRSELKVGQIWARADGTDSLVEIREIGDEFVRYGEHANDRTYETDLITFQCKYCLVLE